MSKTLSGSDESVRPGSVRLGVMMTIQAPTTTSRYCRIPSPIGELLLVGDRGKLSGLFVADHRRSPVIGPGWISDDEPFEQPRRQLGEYFDGTRTEFELDMDLAGTPFQVAVWRALLEVGYGETASYGEIARGIGRPAACRAVGAANGRNPISIVVPCHRVIGGNGTLTGYGWGTERKAWLLDHERATRAGRG
jgi:methylated-DNA-[protein]-cysteine S-methyltransferase